MDRSEEEMGSEYSHTAGDARFDFTTEMWEEQYDRNLQRDELLREAGQGQTHRRWWRFWRRRPQR